MRLHGTLLLLGGQLLGSAFCSGLLACSLGERGTGPSADAGAAGANVGLRLVPTRLQLLPGQTAELVVQVRPARARRVQLQLVGDSGHAYLSDLEIYTDSQGVGRFHLTAAYPLASFRVIARSNGSAVESAVEVSAATPGELSIEPVYAGRRNVEQWTASVRAGSACHLLRDATTDGPLVARAPAGERPMLRGVTVGQPLAVMVRAGHAVAGCADIGELRDGERRSVTIEVQDRPIRFSGVSLPVSWQTQNDDDTLAVFERDIDALLLAWNDAESDVDFVLDAMRAELTEELPRLSFDSRRESDAWRSLLGASLEPELASHGLRDRVRDWMLQGAQLWLNGEGFAGQLLFASDDAERAWLSLQRVAGFPATQLGFAETYLVQVSRHSQDRLALDLGFYWVSSDLLGGLARVGADQAGDMSAALVEFVGCDTLAATLTSGGAPAFSDCGTSCVTTLCQRALATTWRTLENIDPLPVALEVSGEAVVAVDDQALPVALDGAWQGTLGGTSDEPATLSGRLTTDHGP